MRRHQGRATPPRADEATGAGRRPGPVAAWLLGVVLAVLALGFLAPSPARAAALDEWREALARTRALAENDVPRAYEAAKRLQAGIPPGATPADRAHALNVLARAATYSALTPEADARAREALEVATAAEDKVGQAEALLNLALTSVHLGEIERLTQVTTRSVEVLDGVDRPDLLGEALLRTSVMYRRIGQLEDAVTMAMRAWEIGQRQRDPMVLAYAHQGLGISFDQADQPHSAAEHFEQMRKQARQAGSALMEAYALVGMSGSVGRLGEPSKAEALLRQAVAQFRKIGSPVGLGHGLHSLAYFLRTQGRYEEAQVPIQEEVAIYERYRDKPGRWYAWNLRSANFQSLGDPAAAMADAEAAYKIAQEIGLPSYIAESAQTVAGLAALRGDHARAYSLSVQAAELTAKASRERTTTRVLEMTKRYETESRRREIEELTRRNVAQTAELQQRELQQRWLATVLGGSVVALVGAAFFLLRLRESHRMLRAAVRRLQDSQNELQHQTGILRSILDSMGDGVSVANEKGEWLLINPTAERIIGSRPVPGAPSEWSRSFGLYLPDQHTPFPTDELPLVRAIHGESVDGAEVFLRNAAVPEGRWLSVKARPLRDAAGAVRGGVAVFADVTDSKRREEEIRSLNASLEQRVQERTAQLRQQTRYLRVLFDTLPLWVWLKDTDSRYLAVNEACARSCGRAVASMVGRTDAELWSRGRADQFRADDVEVMETRQRRTVESPLTPGGAGWLETYTAAVIDEDGTVLGTVGVARDISERKAAESAREKALAEAEHLARMRSEFLAQMSHELRTPLNGILGYAQILRRDKTLGERQVAGLKVIQQSGEHLLMLINDILDLSKIEAGKLELCPADIPLDDFLNVIAEVIRVKAEQKLLVFEYDKAPDLPAWIRSDEQRLRQVLLNLLANAVKFTDCGKVSLRVRFLPPSRLHFEVQDTGVGIDAEQQEHIFEPFEQAGEPQRRQGGAGLGLAISRRLVRLMGGDIRVKSRLGEGSTFWFELDVPVPESGIPAPAAAGMVTGYAGPRRTVLVIDDVAGNRRVLADLLEPLGFTVVEADGARAGIEKAREERPDLILMDVVMPEMDGLEATRRLRRLPGLEDVPVIAVSAAASSGDEQKSLAAGMNAFLPKPVDLDGLLAYIAMLLDLNLIHDRLPPAPPRPPPGEPSPPLPPEALEALHSLVLRGDMRAVAAYAIELRDADPRYRPFAEQLLSLAEGYQSKALLRLVEQHRDAPAAP